MFLFGVKGMCNMPVDINLLPKIVSFNDFGKWDMYIDFLYSIFKRDFIDSKPHVGKIVFRLKYKPKFQDRACTFYHMTHKGDIESERIPDMRRSERLPWCRHTIENTNTYNLCFWEEERNGHHRVCIWLQAEDENGNVAIENNYFVILEVRAEYVLPWTAFCAEYNNQIRKKAKEYGQWLDNVGNRVYTLEELITDIMNREKQGSHENHTTP